MNFELIYQVVRLVPYGRVTTYGAIARYLGSQSARMVGWAMNACDRCATPVPAHRVVNMRGLLTGKSHFGGDDMQQRLEAEGIQVENNQVVDFECLFWDPNFELGQCDHFSIALREPFQSFQHNKEGCIIFQK